ncbi:MAG: DUF1993 family protein [Sphingomonadaceae bacterium]
MPMSLHAAFIPSAMQMLGTTKGLVDKAEGWCIENNKDPSELITCRLIEDMFAFDYQVKSVAVHTAGAIAGVKAGQFEPDMSPPPQSFAAMRTLLDDTMAVLDSYSEDDMENLIGTPVNFAFRGKVVASFVAENFLLSFSQPNFYFHTTTAYDLLRMKGVPVGKLDFMGRMRVRAD